MQHKKKRCTIAKVDAPVTAAKQAITQATTNDNVDQEQNSGTSTITGIQPEVTKKQLKEKQLMMKSLLRKQRIDTVADATDEEKQAPKDKVDAEATKAKAPIDQATTNNDVEQAKSSGVTTIEGIQPDTIKKSSAKQAIDDSANAKSKELTIIVMQLKKRRSKAKKVDVEALKLKQRLIKQQRMMV